MDIGPHLKIWFAKHPLQLQLNGLHQPNRHCMRHLPEIAIGEAFGRRPTVLGASIHSLEALKKAQANAVDYVQYGAIFPTSKPVQPLGLNALQHICQHSTVPVLAVGGISTERRIQECLNHGAYGVSIGSWILQASDTTATLNTIMGTLT